MTRLRPEIAISYDKHHTDSGYKGWLGSVIGVLGLKPLHETHEVKDGKIVRIK